MLTVICCYNNKEMLNELLVSSLDEQSVSCNRIYINTQEYGFKSAAQAYNAVLGNPKEYSVELTDYLMFIHQDIYLSDNKILSEIESLLKTNPNDIFGLAGITSNGVVYSNLQRKENDAYIVNNQLSSKIEAESLDESCFAMTLDLFRKVKFDEKTCFCWHLYAVDFCHDARRKYACRSYVLPYKAYHKYNSDSRQTVDVDFLSVLRKMVSKYKRDYRTLYAPCYTISTSLISYKLKLLRAYMRIAIGRKN